MASLSTARFLNLKLFLIVLWIAFQRKNLRPSRLQCHTPWECQTKRIGQDMSHAHQESTKNASCLVEPSKPMNFLKTSKPVSFRHQKHSNLGIWVNFMIFGICPQPRNLGFPTPKLGYFFDTDFLGRSTTQDFHPKLLFLEEILTCST